LQLQSLRNQKRTQAFFAAVLCGLNSGGFLITKEKTMHMHIDRRPPPIEEVVQRMKARIDRDKLRTDIETIPPHENCRECRARRERSLKHCHLPAQEKPRQPRPHDTGAYVPEMAACLDNDLNLTDGARRCARKIAEYIYRRNREDRHAEITVSYLMKALGRCRRTVQRYLRQLEREGYIEVSVVPSERTRMCFGLVIRLLNPLLPRHRRHRWTESRRNPEATKESQIYIQRFKGRAISRAVWAFYCCEGVWRSYMKTRPPLPPFPITA
jgi:hypothetical protein